jgi:hypothetical protein
MTWLTLATEKLKYICNDKRKGKKPKETSDVEEILRVTDIEEIQHFGPGPQEGSTTGKKPKKPSPKDMNDSGRIIYKLEYVSILITTTRQGKKGGTKEFNSRV